MSSRPEHAKASTLRGAYALALAVPLLALCPDLVLSTAFLPMSSVLTGDLHTSLTWLQVANGLSNAGFATGAVVAAQLGQRYRQRRLFLGYVSIFVLGSLVAVLSSALPLFLVGRVMQGSATGLMMISSLPLAITRFGERRLSWTVAIVNVGLFGAATLGPIAGGLVGGSGDWRVLFWVVLAFGVLAMIAAVFGFPDVDPLDPDLDVDGGALGLTVVGTALVFIAASVVMSTTLGSLAFWLPFVAGLLAMVVLVAVESRRDEPLMPVRELSSQLPVTGTLVAMVGGAVFVTAVELIQLWQSMVAKEDPTSAAARFWPMPVGLVVASVVFGLIFRTRFVPYLVNVGILALVGASALLLELSSSSDATVIPFAAGLLGFGAGATVSPGLFLAGLGVRSSRLGRAFAMVQLLRLTATYAIGPLVVYLAEDQPALADGVHLGGWITVAIALTGLVLSIVVPLLSGARPQAPDLEAWLEHGEQGMSSPTTAVHIRSGVHDEEAHPLIPGRSKRESD